MLLLHVKAVMTESHKFQLDPSDEEEEERKKSFWPFGDILVQNVSMPLRVLVIGDEWYIVIKAYKFTNFETFLYYRILTVALSLHIQSTNSMICMSID